MEEIKIYPKAWFLWFGLLSSFIFIIACGFLTFQDYVGLENDNSKLGAIFMTLLYVFPDRIIYLVPNILFFFIMIMCIFAFSYLIKRILNPRASLIINERGIVDDSSMLSLGFIPWVDINQIYIYEYSNQEFLGISLNNESIYLERISSFKRNAIKLNKKLTGTNTTISIPKRMLKQKMSQVVQMMEQFRFARSS